MGEEERICGTCKNWDSDMSYCPLYPNEEKFEQDFCDDGWEDDNDGSPAVIGEEEKQ